MGSLEGFFNLGASHDIILFTYIILGIPKCNYGLFSYSSVGGNNDSEQLFIHCGTFVAGEMVGV
jgi:hypothetical protein